jgi:hypothetical protein
MQPRLLVVAQCTQEIESSSNHLLVVKETWELLTHDPAEGWIRQLHEVAKDFGDIEVTGDATGVSEECYECVSFKWSIPDAICLADITPEPFEGDNVVIEVIIDEDDGENFVELCTEFEERFMAQRCASETIQVVLEVFDYG